MNFHRLGALALVGSLALSTTAMLAAASPASAKTLTSITFAYDFPSPDFELAPVVVAQDRGYFAAQGLDVKVIFPGNTSTTTKMLATGAADIGFDTTTDMVSAVGAGVPVESIGNFSMSNNWGLFAKPGVALSAAHLKADLKGKKIFSYGDTWTDTMLPFVLKYAGLSASQVKVVTNPNGLDLTYLLDGRVQVATNTTNYEVAGFDTSGTKGKEVELLGTAVGAPNIPIWVYSTTTSYAGAHRATVSAFMKAIASATAWAVANPAAAAADFTKAYPKSGYSAAYSKDGWSLTVPFMKNSSGKYFVQTNAQWSTLCGAMKSVKAVTSCSRPSSYYTNKFLPTT